MFIKSIIVLMLVLIFISLFSALAFLFRRDTNRTGTARALTWRIGLSVTLFVLLMIGLYFGIIPQHGLSPAPGR